MVIYNTFDEVEKRMGNYFRGSADGSGNRRLTSPDHGRMVFDFVKQTSENAWICEIGSLYGYLTIIMAMACLGSNRRVVSIDHMIGDYCMDMAKRPKCIYQEFVDNLIHFGVWNKVIPFPMKSFGTIQVGAIKSDVLAIEIIRNEYFQAFEMLFVMGAEFELIYVDGNHSYENVIQELQLYTRLLKKGGVIAGDDCYVYHKNFLETFKRKQAHEDQHVAKAVFAFFTDNDEFEPIGVPLNQFGFRKL